MTKYKCNNCGYSGHELIFQFNLYTYCVATNQADPEYMAEAPDCLLEKGYGEAQILEPVSCPKCHAWGVHNFEIVDYVGECVEAE